VLRVCFILGNVTAKQDSARHYLFAEPLALDTLVNVLANHYQHHLTVRYDTLLLLLYLFVPHVHKSNTSNM